MKLLNLDEEQSAAFYQQTFFDDIFCKLIGGMILNWKHNEAILSYI